MKENFVKRGEKREIQVKFQSGEIDRINSCLLNTCIETGRITDFRRRAGWVRVGSDPVRGSSGRFNGVERRSY